jgi:hypothetical protein
MAISSVFETTILRQKTAAEWATQNPIIQQGELVLEEDTYFIKIGDGDTRYNDLNYMAPFGPTTEIDPAFLPLIATTETYVVADQAGMLSAPAQRGDLAIRTDLSSTFVLRGNDPTLLGDWEQLPTPPAPPDLVTSVNGQQGVVVLDADDIDDAATTNKFVTAADLTNLGNQSGINTGDQNIFSTIAVLGQNNVVADSTSDTLNIVAGTNISITTDDIADAITINATGAAAGEANTASNLGGGAQLFAQKSGIDLQFRSVTSSDLSVRELTTSANELNMSTVQPFTQFFGGGTVQLIDQQRYVEVTVDTTIVLTASPAPGQEHWISKSYAGGAITVEGQGGDLIEGDVNDVITAENVIRGYKWNGIAGEWVRLNIDWTDTDRNLITTGTITGSNLSGTNTGDQTSIVGITGTKAQFDTAVTDGDFLYVGDAELNTVDSVNAQTGAVVLDADDIDDTLTAHKFVTAGDLTNLSNLSGTNTGDQTSIVGITGTKVQFDTALTDGDFLYVGDAELNTVDSVNGQTGAVVLDADDISDAATTNKFVTAADITNLSNLSGTNSGDQNLFSTIAVSGQNNVIADTTTDTLTLVAGTNVTITTDDTTDSITINSSAAGGGESLQQSQIFTASGTWNRPVGITKIKVRVIGGGGGGGGAQASAGGGGTRVASAGGGAAGGYSEKIIDVSAIPSATITIGVGGAAGASNGADGGTGGTSSFDIYCSATGGIGGTGTGAAASDGTSTLGGLTPGAGVNGDFNLTGNCGNTARNSAGLNAGGGNGGGAPLSAGGGAGGFADGVTTLGPVVGTNGGGGGGAANRGGGGQSGAVGGNGIIIIEEYG